MSTTDATPTPPIITNCSVLMCVAVASLLRTVPKHLAHIRSAGTTGFSTYEELVAGNNIPVCVEVASAAKMKGLPTPMHIPVSQTWKATLPGSVLVTVTPQLSSMYGAHVVMTRLSTIMPFEITLQYRDLNCPNIIYNYYGFDQNDTANAKEDTTNWESLNSAMLYAFKMPTCYKRIQLHGLQHVTHIKADFMKYCHDIESIDLSALTGVTTVSNSFMSDCKSLKVVDVSSFASVTSMGAKFLGSCNQLHTVILPKSMPGLKVIPSFFLSMCKALKHVHNLRGMTVVTDIHPYFMMECTSYVDGITLFGGGDDDDNNNDGAAAAPSSATTTITQPKRAFGTNVTSIGDNFMKGCVSLESIDVGGFTNVKYVLDSFLEGCMSLEHITNFNKMSSITKVGQSFLQGCSNLESIQLSPSLDNVETIGSLFMSECARLEYLDLAPLEHITVIQSHFLSGCSDLVTINLSGLKAVRCIHSHFMYECFSLKDVDVSPLSNATYIGDAFLSKCTSLTTIDISPLVHVESAESTTTAPPPPCFAFRGCKNLKEVIWRRV